jgi:hypothetical protein
MGTQAQYWTDIYATTHEQRLKESMDTARKELVDRYGANATYLKYLDGELALYEQELTKAQSALADYETKRGGKQGVSADDAAALLGVIAKAGGDIADATGAAAQRKLQAEAAVMERYRLNSAQSNSIGGVASDLQGRNVNAVTSSPDLNRYIRESIDASISAGTFAPGSEAAKAAASQLFSTLDQALQTNPQYVVDAPAIQAQMSADIGAKLGVDPKYVDRTQVDADVSIDIGKAQRTVGVTGTDTSKKAAKLAEDELLGKLDRATPAQKQAVKDFQEKYGQEYFMLIEQGRDISAALQDIAGREDVDSEDLMAKFEAARSALAEVGDYDSYKFFDPAYVSLYGRTISTGGKLQDIRMDRSKAIKGLGEVPTEEMARRRGAEIYEPISPGVYGRAKEARTRLEESRMRGELQGSEGPGTIDDFLATRMASQVAPISESQKIHAGASAWAVREGPLSEATGEWDAENDPGFRLYNNVREKVIRDVTPDALVQHASDLAGGDAKKRDEILKQYYRWTLGEKMGKETQKRDERVKEFDKPKPTDISGIKLEDVGL